MLPPSSPKLHSFFRCSGIHLCQDPSQGRRQLQAYCTQPPAAHSLLLLLLLLGERLEQPSLHLVELLPHAGQRSPQLLLHT